MKKECDMNGKDKAMMGSKHMMPGGMPMPGKNHPKEMPKAPAKAPAKKGK